MDRQKQNSPRIVFMGTPSFAVATLKKLYEQNYHIVAVITAPGKKAGRGQKISQSEVKKYAIKKGLPVLQPTNLKDPAFVEELRSYRPELNIVVAFRMLPVIVWDMPPKGTVNLHASLLPQYRGAAPINHAIINGEKETGVTTFFISHKIDTGQVIFREKVAIKDTETAGELHDRLMEIGASLMIKTVDAIIKNKHPKQEQTKFINSATRLKAAPKIDKAFCQVNWNKNIHDIYNHIRGLSPFPGAYTELISPEGEKHYVKVYKAEKTIQEHDYQVGSIQTDGNTYLSIAVPGGFIKIREIQLSGKGKMPVTSFLKGFPIDNTWRVKVD